MTKGVDSSLEARRGRGTKREEAEGEAREEGEQIRAERESEREELSAECANERRE